MQLENKDEFLIGDWLIQPGQHRIRGSSKVTRVEPKVMDVLICLADQPGVTVSREQLLEKVWTGTIVTDDVLTRSVSELRKAFEDDARNPAVIETIPKIGYRLIAPLRPDLRGDSVPPEIPTVTLSASSVFTREENTPRRPPYNYLVVGAGLILLLASLFLWLNGINTEWTPQAYHSLPLTTYPGHEGRPVLSPDGKQVAFSWSGPNDDNVDIYIKLVGSETPLRLTDSPARDFMPAWSPEGDQIAYMRREDQNCDIYLVEVLGGPSRKLASCGNNIYGDLVWSPDGNWLAFNDRSITEEPFHIILLSPTTLERQTLTSPPSGSWGDHDPAFSPDGKRLSFTRSLSEGMQDIYTIPLEAGNAFRLTNDSRNISGHTWDQKGDAIIFSSNRTGRSGLWRINANGGVSVWLGAGDGPAYFPHIAGRRLAYQMGSGQTNIWLTTRNDTAGAVPLITSTWWDLHPQWSPDGRHIAFTSNRSGSFEIWLAAADGSQQRKLTSFNGPFTSTPRWSPDGKHLVFTSRPDGQADVYILTIDEAKPRLLTEASTDEMAASWSQDGNWIYFSSNRTGSWEIWRKPAMGSNAGNAGFAERVTNNGGFGAVELIDGKSLFYARHNAKGLWRRPVDDGEEEQVLQHLDSRDWGNWAVIEEGLYYVSRGRPTVIAFLEFSSGRTDTLFIPQHGIPWMDPALAVSSSGKKILFGQSEQNESDLMYVDEFR